MLKQCLLQPSKHVKKSLLLLNFYACDWVYKANLASYQISSWSLTIHFFFLSVNVSKSFPMWIAVGSFQVSLCFIVHIFWNDNICIKQLEIDLCLMVLWNGKCTNAKCLHFSQMQIHYSYFAFVVRFWYMILRPLPDS